MSFPSFLPFNFSRLIKCSSNPRKWLLKTENIVEDSSSSDNNRYQIISYVRKKKKVGLWKENTQTMILYSAGLLYFVYPLYVIIMSCAASLCALRKRQRGRDVNVIHSESVYISFKLYSSAVSSFPPASAAAVTVTSQHSASGQKTFNYITL